MRPKPTPATKPTPEEIQEQVEERRINPPKPEDLGEFKGQYRYIPTGEIFGLKVLDAADVRANRTHQAKSARKFWDGTAAEFRELFDKV